MEFRLTYAGPLLAHRDGSQLAQRSLHVHKLRKEFHKQMKLLWTEVPVLKELHEQPPEWHAKSPGPPVMQRREADGFSWLPLVTRANGLICKVDILMLRNGQPGKVVYDIDNRVKTLFDALRIAKGPKELGAETSLGQSTPGPDETPFYVLLEDDNLITHVAVTSDTLLEAVPSTPFDEAVRLVINVTVLPYLPYIETLGFG